MLRIASRAASLRPGDPLARVNYADSLTLSGQHGTAVAQIEASLGNAPASAQVLRVAARVMGRAGEPDKAISLMQRALQYDPMMRPALLGEPLASSHYLAGRYQEAAEGAAQCLQRAPGLVLCLRWSAAALAQAGLLSEARQHAQGLRDAMPGIRIGALVSSIALSHRNSEDSRHLAEGLRKAGLPD
jgi:adenylate cyclase